MESYFMRVIDRILDDFPSFFLLKIVSTELGTFARMQSTGFSGSSTYLEKKKMFRTQKTFLCNFIKTVEKRGGNEFVHFADYGR